MVNDDSSFPWIVVRYASGDALECVIVAFATSYDEAQALFQVYLAVAACAGSPVLYAVRRSGFAALPYCSSAGLS